VDRTVAVPEALTRDSRPRLAAKARLRFDRKENRYMLLYPERGLALNGSAGEIVKLCTGELSIAGMAERLAAKYGQETAAVERQAIELLSSLAERGLLELEPAL